MGKFRCYGTLFKMPWSIQLATPKHLNHVTDRCLTSVTFSAGYIAKIIRNLNSKKAHEHDNISIRMLKICVDTFSKPLELILSRPLSQAHILLIGKRVISFLFTKKLISKTLNITDRYIAKFLKGFQFFFLENNLITQKQSGFKPGASCINQLLSITIF